MKNITGYLIVSVLSLIIALTVLYCAVAGEVVGLFGYFVIVIAGVSVYNRVKIAICNLKG